VIAGAYDQFLSVSRRVLALLLPQVYVGGWWADMAVVACAYTLLLLAFVRVAGFPARVRRARREMVAHAYGILLYRRSFRMVVRFEARLVWANLKLLAFLAPTLLFGGLLFAGAAETLSDRYAATPLPAGTEFVVRVHSTGDLTRGLAEGDVHADPSGFEQTGRVRSAAHRTVWTRLRALRSGIVPLLTSPDAVAGTTVNIGSNTAPVHRWQYAGGLEIYVNYPAPRGWWAENGWLAPFFVFCAVGSVPAARALRVRL
jgi:hypothetical protein